MSDIAFTAYKGKLKMNMKDKFSLLENNIFHIDALKNADSCGQEV
jgi:hypothetical protein